MKKVFCENCYYSNPQKNQNDNLFYNTKWCWFDEDFEEEENYTGVSKTTVYKKNSDDRNEDGDCSHYKFKRKWWKLWTLTSI